MEHSDLGTKYKEHCVGRKIDPLQSVLRFFKEAKEAKGDKGPIDIIIKGNDKYNFHDRVTDEHLEVITEILTEDAHRVTKIDLRYDLLTDNGAKSLAGFLKVAKNVAYINLIGNSITALGAAALAEALKGSDSLAYFNINGNSIGTDGCIAVTELIFYNPKLKHLDLGNNDIKYDGIIALANVVSGNYTVEVLNMENPSFLFFSVGEEWAVHIAKMVAGNMGLRKLSLRKHKLRCDGIYTIMEHLLENNKLKVLDLSANEIAVEGCAAIGKYLRQEGCVLEALHMANNKTGDLGAKTIGQALAVNKSLSYFDFTYNNVHDEGLSRLAESLKINASLQMVKLFGHNYFGQESLTLFFGLQDAKAKGFMDFRVYLVDDHYDLAYVDHEVNPAWKIVE